MGYSCHMLMTKTSLRENIDKGQGSVAEANVGQSSVDFRLYIMVFLRNN